KTPAWRRRTLPAPPSSAGVPTTTTRPGNGRPAVPATAAAAAPAPAADAALTLWPQARPIAGSAADPARIRQGGARAGPGTPPPLDPAASLLEELGEPGGGLLLLVGQLRVGVDAECQVPQLLGQPVHRLRHVGFQGLQVAHRPSWGVVMGSPRRRRRPRGAAPPARG